MRLVGTWICRASAAALMSSSLNSSARCSPGWIAGILNSRRAITGDTALRLAHFFGTSPEFWLNLQKLYELRLAEQKAGREIEELPTLHSRETLLT